jgi:hypothetical protein
MPRVFWYGRVYFFLTDEDAESFACGLWVEPILIIPADHFDLPF